MKKILSITIRTCALILLFFIAQHADAATLRLNPNTGVYTVGKPFTVSVLINTDGKPVNAADGQLTFNPRELQVTAVSRGSSIFNLWTEEPAYSNSAGTVSFGGGSPSGYKGAGGVVMSVTFKALGAGTPKVNFKSGSILAADGMGTNILTSMSGGTYTVAAQSDSPAPEYIPPANTPQAPKVTSATHPDQEKWYKESSAKLSWTIPSGVTAMRTLLDDAAGTVPTIVYDTLITEKTIDELPQGTSYFHIQFKNADGWGRITHYKLRVDTEAPKSFTITEVENADTNNPNRVLTFTLEDVSPVPEYKIQIDGKDPFVYKDEAFEKKYTLEPLDPGYHTLTIEAFDSAGNSAIASYSLTIEAFEKPHFVEYPSRINTEVIPAIKGTTRPNAEVTIRVALAEGDNAAMVAQGEVTGDSYTVKSNENGEFVFIPSEPFESGVYSITAVARDTYGRVSERSDEIKIIVEVPGYITFGAAAVSLLSVLIPLIALVILLFFGSWYLWHRLSRWKKRVRKETLEAEESLTLEFNAIIKNFNAHIEAFKETRKGKLTKAESELISQIEDDLTAARKKIAKEIEDIEDIVT
jgi:hypothetical protein